MGFLKTPGSREKPLDTKELSKTSDPKRILSMITKCEALIAELKNTGGNDDVINELLTTLAKLKIMLLHLFKKKQRKFLDLNWEKMREENTERRKKSSEQIEALKKSQESKSAYNKTK